MKEYEQSCCKSRMSSAGAAALFYFAGEWILLSAMCGKEMEKRGTV